MFFHNTFGCYYMTLFLALRVWSFLPFLYVLARACRLQSVDARKSIVMHW